MIVSSELEQRRALAPQTLEIDNFIGTDKTAAELALVRLEKEIAAVHAEWDAANQQFSRLTPSSSTSALLGMVGAVIVAVFSFVGLFGVESDLNRRIVSLPILALAITVFIFFRKRNAEAVKSFAKGRAQLWRPYSERLHKLALEVARNRKLLE